MFSVSPACNIIVFLLSQRLLLLATFEMTCDVGACLLIDNPIAAKRPRAQKHPIEAITLLIGLNNTLDKYVSSQWIEYS